MLGWMAATNYKTYHYNYKRIQSDCFAYSFDIVSSLSGIHEPTKSAQLSIDYFLKNFGEILFLKWYSLQPDLELFPEGKTKNKLLSPSRSGLNLVNEFLFVSWKEPRNLSDAHENCNTGQTMISNGRDPFEIQPKDTMRQNPCEKFDWISSETLPFEYLYRHVFPCRTPSGRTWRTCKRILYRNAFIVRFFCWKFEFF